MDASDAIALLAPLRVVRVRLSFRESSRRKEEIRLQRNEAEPVAVVGFGRMALISSNRPTLEAELATAGQEGWELVHFWPDTSLHQEKDGHLLIFKRAAD